MLDYAYLFKNFDDALRCLKQADEHLEAAAEIVQIYLKLDRVDLAKCGSGLPTALSS